MTPRIIEWAKTHQGAAAGIGAGALVGGAALYSRHKAAAASAVIPTVAAAPATDTTAGDTTTAGGADSTGTDAYGQFADALSQFADQQQQTAQATVDALSQLGAQQQQTITAAVAAAVPQAQPATAAAPRPAPTASLFQSTAGGQHEQTLQQVADRYRMSTAEIQQLNPGISLNAPLAAGTKIQVNKPYSEIANLPPEHIK